MYNGWSNPETWRAALWLDNDRGLHDTVREMTREALDTESDTSAAALTLSRELEELIEDGNPITEREDLYSDFLTAALSEIDYIEIAESWIEETKGE